MDAPTMTVAPHIIDIPEINLSNNNSDNIVEATTLDLDIPSSEPEETDIESSNRDSLEEKSRVNVLTEINIEAKNNRNIDKTDVVPISSTSTTSISLTQSPTIETELDPKPGCSAESTSVSSSAEETPSSAHCTVLKKRRNCAKLKIGLINNNTNIHNNNTNINNNKYAVKLPLSSLPKVRSTDASTSNIDGMGIKVKKVTLRVSSISNQSPYSPTSLSSRDSCSDNSGRSSVGTFESARGEKKKDSLHSISANTGNSSNKLNRKLTRNESDLMIAPTSARNSKRSILSKNIHPMPSTNINISADFCKESNQRNCDEQSNMFLYIDLHGHASKKGVFMYGNYLPNIAESVECMLLPRLMSMNSHHFHFDACVFSERNMYHKYVEIWLYIFCLIF